jgi:hypothetical protein
VCVCVTNSTRLCFFIFALTIYPLLHIHPGFKVFMKCWFWFPDHFILSSDSQLPHYSLCSNITSTLGPIILIFQGSTLLSLGSVPGSLKSNFPFLCAPKVPLFSCSFVVALTIIQYYNYLPTSISLQFHNDCFMFII